MAPESQPFKHQLLDTLESQPINVFMNPKGRAAPNFGSLLAQDHGGFAQNQSLYPFDQSIVSGATPLTKGKPCGHSLKVMLHCFGQVEMIKDKDMPVKF